MTADLQYWWKLIKTTALFIGLLLSFFAIIEVLHAYAVLKDIHPVLGNTFLVIFIFCLAYFPFRLFVNINKRPRALIPPDIKDSTSFSDSECQDYAKYLTKLLKRLSKNPNIDASEIKAALGRVELFEQLLPLQNDPEILSAEINRIEKETIIPFLDQLDQQARAEVRKCVRDIMLGVTLSPYRAVDLIIVLYRNIQMVSRVVSIYNNRPLLIEQIAIFRDVFKVVATVNYLNFGEKLMEQFFSRVPFVGQALDDVAQGIGAGLMTSAAGHSTIYRCRAFRSWNQEEAIQTLSSHLKGFFSDVKGIFKEDVLPRSKDKIYSSASIDEKADPMVWQKITDGFSGALDATDSMLNVMIRKPVAVTTRTVASAGSSSYSKAKTGLAKTGSVILKPLTATGRLLRKPFRRKKE